MPYANDPEKCTPSMLVANLMGDGPQIVDAILIYRTDAEKLHWFRVGSNGWAIGAMHLVTAELTEAFLATPDEADSTGGDLEPSENDEGRNDGA